MFRNVLPFKLDIGAPDANAKFLINMISDPYFCKVTDEFWPDYRKLSLFLPHYMYLAIMPDSFFYLSCQPPWVEYFTYLALGASMRSKDPKTQVGCVIVDSVTLKVSI